MAIDKATIDKMKKCIADLTAAGAFTVAEGQTAVDTNLDGIKDRIELANKFRTLVFSVADTKGNEFLSQEVIGFCNEVGNDIKALQEKAAAKNAAKPPKQPKEPKPKKEPKVKIPKTFETIVAKLNETFADMGSEKAKKAPASELVDFFMLTGGTAKDIIEKIKAVRGEVKAYATVAAIPPHAKYRRAFLGYTIEETDVPVAEGKTEKSYKITGYTPVV